MDYFWLFAPISAGFGALVTAVALWRSDISRASYREAKQMLSAMVCSLSRRIEANEALTREVSEQLQILSATQGRLGVEGQTGDTERLLEFMQDWVGNVKGVVEKVGALQRSLRSVEQEIQDMGIRMDHLGVSGGHGLRGAAPPLGVVTEDTLAKLTPTERTVLELLIAGPKPAPEIGRLAAKSREHTARLMKSLFEQGFVERQADRQPYEYRLNDRVREALAHSIGQIATRLEG